MPIVRIIGWRGGRPPLVPPQSIARILADAAGMDEKESLQAVTRLMQGKSVDAHFDPSAQAAAKILVERTQRIGLHSKLYDDN